MGAMFEGVGRELGRAVRRLFREPGFTGVAVTTLAVGLGATAALVTLIDAILLRPLAVPEADRVVRIYHSWQGGPATSPVAPFALPFFRENARSFEAMGAYWGTQDVTLGGEGGAERIRGVRATAGLVSILGGRPAAGRLHTVDDAVLEEAPGVVLAHGLWVRRYGADPTVVGRTVELDGVPRPVLGVMAEEVELPGETVDVWFPYEVPAGVRVDDSFRLNVLARLAPGADLETARAEMTALTGRFPELADFYRMVLDDMKLVTGVRPLRDEVVGEVERPLWIVLGAVLLLLAVAAANVATLFLVRAEGRSADVAVRRALGAGRGGILGHFLAESMVVALAAGAVGLGLAAGAVALFARLAPPDLPRLDELAVGGTTVVAVLVLSLVVAGALGAYPVWRFGRVGSAALGRRGTAGAGRAEARVGGALVVAQVALALVLLSGSGLLVRTLQQLRAVDPGFRAEGVVTATLSLTDQAYPTVASVQAFRERLEDRIREVPGVEAVALGPSPLGDPICNGLFIEAAMPREGELPPCVPVQFVGPGYWDVLGIDVLEGRVFGDAEADGPPLAVVSENVARRLWPDGGALQAAVHPTPRPGPPWFPVTGITASVRGRGPDQPPTEALYLPLDAMADEGWLLRGWTLLLRTGPGAPVELGAALREAVAELDPGVPVTLQGSLAEAQARTMRRSRLTLFLLGTAAATTLLLGLVGLYGVVAHRIGSRRAEIGLRMALGAEGSQVQGMVLGHSLRLVGLGLVLGLGGSLAVTRVLSSLLYGVEPGDPASLAGAVAALLSTAAIACWIPARRASRVDPVRALRNEG